ncbi:MAG: YqgE/AlgH family protein [Pseudomonadota bacterium]
MPRTPETIDDLPEIDLTGQLLIAMPGMGDTPFERSVIYLCAHSDEGAMGLVVNHVVSDLSFRELLSQLEIEASAPMPGVRVHMGGPVEHGRGFVLHSGDYREGEATLRVNDAFAMTATLDILEDIARGEGPEHLLMALGYAGWGPGQLEGELARNAWLTCTASSEIVFETDAEAKWERALATLGIDPLLLSAASGRA